MGNRSLAAGIDIGGTRTKLGVVDLTEGTIINSCVFDTVRSTHEDMMAVIKEKLEYCLDSAAIDKGNLKGAGISIGSYVFNDGKIDGMKCFVPFMVEGYPLVSELEKTLCIPVRADNDVRVINLAEAIYGVGRGYKKAMTITLGSGIGIGISEDGIPFGREAFNHMAGHIKVRSGMEIPGLDSAPCYCGLRGCFEGTCSGTSLEAWTKSIYGNDISNPEFFDLALNKDEKALTILNRYMEYLADALNQYIYVYCPDIIVLGGGVAKGLSPYLDELKKRVTAKVHYKQHTEIVISELMEEGGILGAALLMR